MTIPKRFYACPVSFSVLWVRRACFAMGAL